MSGIGYSIEMSWIFDPYSCCSLFNLLCHPSSVGYLLENATTSKYKVLCKLERVSSLNIPNHKALSYVWADPNVAAIVEQRFQDNEEILPTT